MCSIIAYSGLLPKGVLSRMLIEAETRGKDSTGVAFRTTENGRTVNVCYRNCVPASDFIQIHEDVIGQARRSFRGIAHTRRASPGMPIDNTNAHPYTYPYGSAGKYFFAHNGRITNWKALKDSNTLELELELVQISAEHGVAKCDGDASDEEASIEAMRAWSGFKSKTEISAVAPEKIHAIEATHQDVRDRIKAVSARLSYLERATTDSMVLGPCIETRDFSQVDGCMAIVWIRADSIFAFRQAKEGVAYNIVWKYKEPMKGEPVGDQVVTIVASVPGIVNNAFAKLAETLDYDIKECEFGEGHIYKVTPTGLEDEGAVPVHRAFEDTFSSERVGPETTKDKIEE